VIRAERTRFRAGRSKLGHAFFEERRPEGHMLGPGDGAIENGRVLYRFGNEHARPIQPDAALELKLSSGKKTCSRQFTIAH
jgi:hypothetical protein